MLGNLVGNFVGDFASKAFSNKNTTSNTRKAGDIFSRPVGGVDYSNLLLNNVDFTGGKSSFLDKKEDKKDNFLTKFLKKGFGEDEEGNTYQERFAKGLLQSYMPQEKSSGELITDEIAKGMGLSGGGFNNQINPSFSIVQNPGSLAGPTVIQGQQGQPGFLEKAATIGISSFLCDIRTKEDIAPLCESEVNDLLSECAFFVKDLNECS